LSSETYRTAGVLRCRRGLCERTRRCLHRRRDRQSRNQDDELTHVRPLFFFRFPPDPLRERERQNVMDAFERLYRFYSLNMTCIKLALLSHPLWIGCESKIGAIFAFSMAKWNRATRMRVRRTSRQGRGGFVSHRGSYLGRTSCCELRCGF